MFGQCPIFAYLGLRSIQMLCEQAKIGEYGVLAEYLQQKNMILTEVIKVVNNPREGSRNCNFGPKSRRERGGSFIFAIINLSIGASKIDRHQGSGIFKVPMGIMEKNMSQGQGTDKILKSRGKNSP